MQLRVLGRIMMQRFTQSVEEVPDVSLAGSEILVGEDHAIAIWLLCHNTCGPLTHKIGQPWVKFVAMQKGERDSQFGNRCIPRSLSTETRVRDIAQRAVFAA